MNFPPTDFTCFPGCCTWNKERKIVGGKFKFRPFHFWSPRYNERVILTKFHKDWPKIVDFLLLVNFLVCQKSGPYFIQSLLTFVNWEVTRNSCQGWPLINKDDLFEPPRILENGDNIDHFRPEIMESVCVNFIPHT